MCLEKKHLQTAMQKKSFSSMHYEHAFLKKQTSIYLKDTQIENQHLVNPRWPVSHQF